MVRYAWWVVKIAVFLLILGFALKNTDAVVVRYYLIGEWRAPLVFVLLVFFAAGVGLGMLSALRQVYRQRREIVALRRDLKARSPGPGDAPAAGGKVV